jgi:hypothetical protein
MVGGLTMSNYDWVFWLNVTNIALGVVVVLTEKVRPLTC